MTYYNTKNPLAPVGTRGSFDNRMYLLTDVYYTIVSTQKKDLIENRL